MVIRVHRSSISGPTAQNESLIMQTFAQGEGKIQHIANESQPYINLLYRPLGLWDINDEVKVSEEQEMVHKVMKNVILYA